MKERDLIIDCPYQQVILYAEKNDGTYGPVQTGSYMAGKHISEHFKIAGELNQSLLGQLKNGNISPVYFFMMIEGLTVAELAARVGMSKNLVKKHLTLKGFQKITVAKLKRYTDVLNIPLANMFQIINTIEDRNWDAGFREELRNAESFLISQGATGNPLLVETRVIQNLK
jgi:transcriptional regulator with XRE-family HTH domain